MSDNLALILGVALSVVVRVHVPLIGCCGVGVCVYCEMKVCHWLVRARDPHVTYQFSTKSTYSTVLIFSELSSREIVY